MAQDHRDAGRARPPAQEGGQRDHDRRRRARDPSDQRAGRRLLPGARRRASSRRCVEQLEWARDDALETVALGARLRRSPTSSATTSSSRCGDPDEYPIDGGRIVSNRGLDIARRRVRRPLRRGARRATRTRCTRGSASAGRTSSGPLARFASNFDRLSPLAREAARAAGLGPDVPQPVPEHRGALRRDGVRLRRGAAADRRRTSRPTDPPSTVEPRAAAATACTEAPRGMLYHRYGLDDEGTILDAKIVPPTSQNQQAIEDDLLRRRSRQPRRCRRRARAGGASRRSATTTRASRARRISSTLERE